MDDSFDLSRRKALAALGTIGVASAGAGLGTSAYFSDQETFENNQLTAGTLDMKVAATEYYSDWSPDEAAYAGMASDADSTDIRLPPGDDQDDAQAIALDLDDDYTGDGDVYGAFFDAISSDVDGNSYNTVNGGVAAATGDAEEPSEGLCDTGSDADGPMIIDIGDVKPGDFGGAQFAFELCDNPGYVWLTGGLRDAAENGVTEPEADDPDEEEGVVELLDEIQVAYGVGPIDGDTTAFEDTDAGFQPITQQSLREFLATIDADGVALDGDIEAELGGGTGEQGCFAGGNPDEPSVHQVSVVWWLPIDHGNQVQSDSVSFDLGFYTEQCRHNDGETALEAYYPFEGSADDVSGNEFDGTLEGDVSFTSGKVGQAAAFDTSDYVEVPGFIDASTVQSRFAWVKPTGGVDGAYPRVFHQSNHFELGWKQGSNEWGVYNGSSWYTFGTAPSGEWQHIGVVWDGTNLIGYKNGQSFQLTTSGGSSSTAPIRIGANPSPSGDKLAGQIDDVRIYSRALSASEVQDLYDSA